MIGAPFLRTVTARPTRSATRARPVPVAARSGTAGCVRVAGVARRRRTGGAAWTCSGRAARLCRRCASVRTRGRVTVWGGATARLTARAAGGRADLSRTGAGSVAIERADAGRIAGRAPPRGRR